VLRLLYLADIRFPLDRANGIQTMETCYALADRGNDVRLLVRPDTTPPQRDPFAFYGLAPQPRLRIDRVPVVGPHPLRRFTYVIWATLAAAGARRAVDVVMTRDLMIGALVVRMPRAFRPPLVYESHGLAAVFAERSADMLTGGVRAAPAKLRRLNGRERRVWCKAEGYVTITDALRSDLAGLFGARTNVMVVPDGARLAASSRQSHPGASASPLVVYAGHLYPWKGVDVLLRALTRLPSFRAVIAGGHPAEQDVTRLKALAATLGVEERVSFTGFIDRASVPSLLATADVLVMPHTSTPVSDRYASPLKLFEYMAAGKPIVASDLAAVREILRGDENACLVRPGDEAALAAGLERVARAPEFAARLAAGALQQAQSYTWARRAERLESVLQAAVRA
jgi:glycosyltransferase involved in cell wall biosynthesis